MIKNISKRIKKFTILLSEVSYRIKKEQKIFFRIVDMNNGIVKLHVKGKASSMKKDVLDVIYETHIISGLSSPDACSLGVFYGYNLKSLYSGKNSNYPLLCISNEGRYRLTSENRDGNIEFIDTKTDEKFCKCPIIIAKDYQIIEQFDPTQACYIGILAGIKSRKLEDNQHKTTYENNVVPIFDSKKSNVI